MTLEDRLTRIEAMLAVLVERQKVKDWYSVDEVASQMGKASFHRPRMVPQRPHQRAEAVLETWEVRRVDDLARGVAAGPESRTSAGPMTHPSNTESSAVFAMLGIRWAYRCCISIVV